MNEPIIIAATMLLATTILSFATLRGWQGWLQLKEREIEHHPREIEAGVGMSGARIEIADLKERIRKLEAIASGVDL
ncbi:MAG: hypothetical protein IE933_13210 [Sphingomonadales bacterium]|nr:hypothetical protein [Sphingomonadales bacterium]MBD3774125.1 hypothetical protein [Paracoccaceae bacterium]